MRDLSAVVNNQDKKQRYATLSPKIGHQPNKESSKTTLEPRKPEKDDMLSKLRAKLGMDLDRAEKEANKALLDRN